MTTETRPWCRDHRIFHNNNDNNNNIELRYLNIFWWILSTHAAAPAREWGKPSHRLVSEKHRWSQEPLTIQSTLMRREKNIKTCERRAEKVKTCFLWLFTSFYFSTCLVAFHSSSKNRSSDEIMSICCPLSSFDRTDGQNPSTSLVRLFCYLIFYR